MIRQSQKVVEQHKKFIQEAKVPETQKPEQLEVSQINSFSANRTLNVAEQAQNQSVVVESPNVPNSQVLRSTEATEEEARRDERRRRQAEMGTDDEADETMIKEKKRKIVKKQVADEPSEEIKKVPTQPKKHQKIPSELPKADEPAVKPEVFKAENPKLKLAEASPSNSEPKQIHSEVQQPPGKIEESRTVGGPTIIQKSPLQKRTLKFKEKTTNQTNQLSEHQDSESIVPDMIHQYQEPVDPHQAQPQASGDLSPSKPRKPENLLIQPQVKFGQKTPMFSTKHSDVPPNTNPLERKPLGFAQNGSSVLMGRPLVLKKPSVQEQQDDFVLGQTDQTYGRNKLDARLAQQAGQEWEV